MSREDAARKHIYVHKHHSNVTQSREEIEYLQHGPQTLKAMYTYTKQKQMFDPCTRLCKAYSERFRLTSPIDVPMAIMRSNVNGFKRW